MPRFIWPLDKYTVSQGFGGNAAYYKQLGQVGHNGIDLATSSGVPVKASADGTVKFEGWGQNNSWMGTPAGICVLINHGDVHTGYAHLQSTIVSAGQAVKQGQVIGYVGMTGTASGPHCHFEFLPQRPDFNNGYAGRVNPANYGVGVSSPTQPQGGEMITTKDQLNRLYDAVLRRPRDGSEGEDVYLGKDSGFVFDDLYRSGERARRLRMEADEKAALVNQRDQANLKSVALVANVSDLTSKLQAANDHIAALEAEAAEPDLIAKAQAEIDRLEAELSAAKKTIADLQAADKPEPTTPVAPVVPPQTTPPKTPPHTNMLNIQQLLSSLSQWLVSLLRKK